VAVFLQLERRRIGVLDPATDGMQPADARMPSQLKTSLRAVPAATIWS